MSNKRETFHGGWSIVLSKAAFKKKDTFLGFINWRNAWCLGRYGSKDKVVKSKSEICSLIHLTQSEILLYTNSNSSQTNSSGISAPSLKFGLGMETEAKVMVSNRFY
jgi:hypothetical protein